MERDVREDDDNNHTWVWAFARILFFLSILLMIAWSGVSSGGENISFEVKANGRPISGYSKSAKKLLSKEAELQEIMKHAALFMESRLYINPHTPRKTVKLVTLSFEDSISVPLVTINSNIYISSKYINFESFEGINVDVEIQRLIYTAMAHVWLWDGKGDAPLGLVGAMANLLTNFAGLMNSLNTIQKAVTFNHHLYALEGEGQLWWTWSLWDDHREEKPLTTDFLGFCEAAKPGFLSALNSKLERGWNQSYFQDIMDTNIEDLWADYKALKFHTLSNSPTTIM